MHCVMITSQFDKGEGTIVLAPNRSATWRTNKLLIAGLGGLSFITASVCTAMGAWVVLPFAGIEVALLAFFMYRVSKATYQKQVLHFGQDHLRLEVGQSHPERTWLFVKNSTFFLVIRPQHELGTHTVYLCDLSLRIELGPFLNQQDKKVFLRVLNSTGLRVRHQAFPLEANLCA